MKTVDFVGLIVVMQGGGEGVWKKKEAARRLKRNDASTALGFELCWFRYCKCIHRLEI